MKVRKFVENQIRELTGGKRGLTYIEGALESIRKDNRDAAFAVGYAYTVDSDPFEVRKEVIEKAEMFDEKHAMVSDEWAAELSSAPTADEAFKRWYDEMRQEGSVEAAFLFGMAMGTTEIGANLGAIVNHRPIGSVNHEAEYYCDFIQEVANGMSCLHFLDDHLEPTKENLLQAFCAGGLSPLLKLENGIPEDAVNLAEIVIIMGQHDKLSVIAENMASSASSTRKAVMGGIVLVMAASKVLAEMN